MSKKNKLSHIHISTSKPYRFRSHTRRRFMSIRINKIKKHRFGSQNHYARVREFFKKTYKQVDNIQQQIHKITTLKKVNQRKNKNEI